MSRTGKDLIVSAVAGIAIVAVFASFDLVESLFEATREHEDWDLDEIIACIPALAIVATWFSLRRWREVAELNRTLTRQAGELADALEQRRAMEEQLREGYKVAAMGTLGGGFAGALRRALEPIERLSGEGLDRTAPESDERTRLEADLRRGEGRAHDRQPNARVRRRRHAREGRHRCRRRDSGEPLACQGRNRYRPGSRLPRERRRRPEFASTAGSFTRSRHRSSPTRPKRWARAGG